MKRWLMLTGLRTAATVAVAGIIIVVLAWLGISAHNNKSLAQDQLNVTSAGLAKIDEAKEVLGKVSGCQDDISKVSDNYKGMTLVVPTNVNSAKNDERFNGVIAKVNSQKTYAMVTQDTFQAESLFTYHTSVCQALVYLLEYSPSKDVKDFDIKSQDTQTRLKLARGGLAQAAKQLRNARSLYSDPSLDTILSSIGSLQTGRDALAKDGDINAWISIVNQAQEAIADNRTSFWRSASTELTKKLNADRQSLAQIQELWQDVN